MKPILTSLAAAAALSLTALGASATTTTFIFDESASSITLTDIGSGCIPGSCELSADFGDVATDWTWTPAAAGDDITVDHFIDWSILLTPGHVPFLGSVPPTGGGLYDVEVVLAFSDPNLGSSNTETGLAGFGTLLGTLGGGFLTWDNGGEGTIAFGDGSELGYNLAGLLDGGLGVSSSSAITFTANSIAPVPLPAAGWMLLAGLGGLVAMKRRKKVFA